MPKPREPSFEQLCAIARDEITADRTIDDFEWRERIKITLAKRRLAYPKPHVLSDAMDRVARALPVGGLTGPAVLTVPLSGSTGTTEHTSRPLSHAESVAALSHLRERFGPLPAMKPRAMPNARPLTAREADRRGALRIVAQAIEAQVAACEEAERADRDLHRARRAEAEGVDEGLRAEGVEPSRGDAR
jgi:hypothetical protein